MMTGSLDVRGSFRAGTHSLVYDDLTGRVGIGTEAPTVELEVDGMVKAAGFMGSGADLIGVNADLLDGLDSVAFALASHTHIGLNADTLDGKDSTYFSPASHTHWGQTWSGKGTGLTLQSSTMGLAAAGGDAPGDAGIYGSSSTVSRTLPGMAAGVWGDTGGGFGVVGTANTGSGVVGLSNSGTGVFAFTESTNPALVARNWGSGPAVQADGDVLADKVRYNSPRTHYYAVASSAFFPVTNVDYSNGYGMGGAYLYSGSAGMHATVDLPQGAVVTSLTVYFNDTSSADVNVSLQKQWYTGGYTDLASVSSSGTAGYTNGTDTSIVNATINKLNAGYMLYAYSTNWSSSLRVMGAVIAYTINEAE